MCWLVFQGPRSVYLLTAFPVAQGLTLGAAAVCVCITGEVHVPFGMQCLLLCRGLFLRIIAMVVVGLLENRQQIAAWAPAQAPGSAERPPERIPPVVWGPGIAETCPGIESPGIENLLFAAKLDFPG